MPTSKGLSQARKAKKDEFYTQLTDIEKELKFYKKKNQFKGKVVFCNCDDPTQSHFWFFFKEQFEELGLKKLITTHYSPSTLFEKSPAYKREYVGGSGNGKKTNIKGNGDFRSDVCVEILKDADIVVTNPPFSLFHEFVAQLIQYKKKFLIIGNVNAVTGREIFDLFKSGKIKMGRSIKSGDREFRVPNDYPLQAAGWRQDDDGNKFIRVKGVRWFTNLPFDDITDTINMPKKYSKKEYPIYDNAPDIIEVGEVKKIPKNYNGLMGVPITFLDKHNPKQFEIVGADYEMLEEAGVKGGRFKLNGKTKYARIVIKHKKGKQDGR